ncbi:MULTISPECIES: hypothetical protein [Segatella]|uniref:hypothetical protein n=1 Tax=Segatella TaxID=2974251 RepID=UPI0012DFD6F7|nr:MULTISPECIES: hypothetical protein [Segatella]MDR4930097.1 hypothetical protein [Segatella bryantii]
MKWFQRTVVTCLQREPCGIGTEGLTYGIGTYHEGDGYATGQTPRQFFDRQRK